MAKECMAGAVRAGRRISPQELNEVRQTVGMCSGLSRLELARTVFEHSGWVGASGSLRLEVVQGKERTGLWNEYVERYHYLGYRQPVGCFLRYFIRSEAGLLGCVLMAGAAKTIRSRDQWIGWDRAGREQNLPWIINNQ